MQQRRERERERKKDGEREERGRQGDRVPVAGTLVDPKIENKMFFFCLYAPQVLKVRTDKEI